MRSTWIRRPNGDASVIFVHGILSSGEACWKHENGTYWPDLLAREPGFEDLGIFVFNYRSDAMSGNYRLDDAVDSLKEELRLEDLLERKRIIFVAHSMGGILVRRFLVKEQLDLIERQSEVGLFLVASPSLGSKVASFLGVFSKILGNSEADMLRLHGNNAWLNDLDKDFINLKESDRLSMRGKELIEDEAMMRFLSSAALVEWFSAARYFEDSFKVPYSDHSSIAKPEDDQAIQHRLLCRFIRELGSEPIPPGPDPHDGTRSEIVYRLREIVQLISDNSSELHNEEAVHLEHLLSGWYTGGAGALEGTSTKRLVQQLEDAKSRDDVLGQTESDLREIEGVLRARTGERQAGVVQNLDYESLRRIRNRLQTALDRLASRPTIAVETSRCE
jgi:hypothetical protein